MARKIIPAAMETPLLCRSPPKWDAVSLLYKHLVYEYLVFMHM